MIGSVTEELGVVAMDEAELVLNNVDEGSEAGEADTALEVDTLEDCGAEPVPEDTCAVEDAIVDDAGPLRELFGAARAAGNNTSQRSLIVLTNGTRTA